MTVIADVLYLVLGPGSLRMTTLRQGDQINLIGPLGRGFWVPEGKTTAIIVAGGMGAPPLQHLGKFLTTHYPASATSLPLRAQRPKTICPSA